MKAEEVGDLRLIALLSGVSELLPSGWAFSRGEELKVGQITVASGRRWIQEVVEMGHGGGG